MAKALEYPIVFSTLMRGGHICEKTPVVGSIKYTVHSATGPLCLGHITERQHGELIRNSIIKPLSQRRIKDGSVLTYWILEGNDA